jgi:hypothetical protein
MNKFAKIIEQSRAAEEKSRAGGESESLTTDQKLDMILSRLDEVDDRLNRIEDRLGRDEIMLDTLADEQDTPIILRMVSAMHRAAQDSTKKTTKKEAAK